MVSEPEIADKKTTSYIQQHDIIHEEDSSQVSIETSKVIASKKRNMEVKQILADSDSFKSDESFYAFIEAQKNRTPLRPSEEREIE